MPDKSWRTCEITQDCCYGWIPENVQKFIDGWSSVKDYAYILHDKDKKDDNTTPREPHIHLMLRFNNAIHTSAILARAKKVGIPADCITENRIQKMKSWSAALNYLTHRDEHKPWKHVYDTAEVISNFDWQLESESAHQAKQLRADKGREKEIVEAIASGEIRLFNLSEHITSYEENLYSKAIKTAFNRRTRDLKLKNERNMEVIFISGESGVGKDTFAREWCKDKDLSYFTTGNNDKSPFDDYMGQDVIIWSDARDDVYKPAQIHTMLDNHWASTQKARFVDQVLNCQYFIITSVKPLNEWYKNFYSKEGEDIKQLYRRIKTWYDMNDKDISCRIYDQNLNEYIYTDSYLNIYGHKSEYLDNADKRVEFSADMRSDGMISLNGLHDLYRRQTELLKEGAKDHDKFSRDFQDEMSEWNSIEQAIMEARIYFYSHGKEVTYNREKDTIEVLDDCYGPEIAPGHRIIL